MRAGTAKDMYHLYSSVGDNSDLQGTCPETCSQSVLREKVWNMLRLYNGSDEYPDVVDDYYCRTSPQPLTWVDACP